MYGFGIYTNIFCVDKTSHNVYMWAPDINWKENSVSLFPKTYENTYFFSIHICFSSMCVQCFSLSWLLQNFFFSLCIRAFVIVFPATLFWICMLKVWFWSSLWIILWWLGVVVLCRKYLSLFVFWWNWCFCMDILAETTFFFSVFRNFSLEASRALETFSWWTFCKFCD